MGSDEEFRGYNIDNLIDQTLLRNRIHKQIKIYGGLGLSGDALKTYVEEMIAWSTHYILEKLERQHTGENNTDNPVEALINQAVLNALRYDYRRTHSPNPHKDNILDELRQEYTEEEIDRKGLRPPNRLKISSIYQKTSNSEGETRELQDIIPYHHVTEDFDVLEYVLSMTKLPIPDDLKTIIRLKFIHERTQKKIAEIMGLSEATISKKVKSIESKKYSELLKNFGKELKAAMEWEQRGDSNEL